MSEFELIVPCHFGMESVLKKEIYDIGYEITDVSDGRVTFLGDEEAVARANIFLRTGERVLLKVGSFHATTYEELFQGTLSLPWEDFLPADARFWVTKAASVKSQLFSPSDIQSVMKKAMVERMKRGHHRETFPETGDSYPVRVFLIKDMVTAAIDTTGESCFDFYIKLKYQADELYIGDGSDCGTGEDISGGGGGGQNPPSGGAKDYFIKGYIAPGVNRTFTAQAWKHLVPASVWKDSREEALELETPDVETDIQGYDIDPDAIAAARANAKLAGVDHLIHFQTRPVSALSHSRKYGFLITNPPYGERLNNAEEEAVRKLYAELGEAYKRLDSWSMYVITSFSGCEAEMGLKAARNRKIYNGMLKTYFYMFPGPKPPRK